MAIKFNIQQQDSQAQEVVQSVAEHKPAFKNLTEEQLMIDELVMIDAEMKKLHVQKMLDRKEELRKKLLATTQAYDPTEPVTLTGTEGTITFSAAPVKMELEDKDALVKKMGLETYIAASKLTITDAKKYLSQLELADIATTTYGTRTLKAIVKNDGGENE